MGYRVPRRENGRGDSGWVIIEVVVAAAVMFFVATALLGVVGASTTLGVFAKADAVAVNQLNSFVDQVRAMPYGDVTQARLTALAQSASRTVNGVSLEVSATVVPRWFAGQDPQTAPPPYKHVRVTIRARGPVGGPVTMTAGTFVSSFMSAGATPSTQNPEPPKPPPTVRVLPPTPQQTAVWGQTAVAMGAQSAGSGVTLTELQMTAAGSLVLSKATTLEQDEVSGMWDTAAMADGRHEMRAQARDSLGQLGDVAWTVWIDNVRAAAPANLVLNAVEGNSAVTFSWTESAFTSDTALSYGVSWESLTPTGGTTTTFSVVPLDIGQPTQRARQLTGPFSRGRMHVAARGPRAHFTGHVGSQSPTVTSGWYISRPALTATSTVVVSRDGNASRKAELRLTLGCDAPRFPVSGQASYVWQYKYGTGNWTHLATTSVPAHSNAAWIAPVNGKFVNIGVRCVVSLTPVGGSAVAVPSAVLVFTPGMGPPNWSRWDAPPVTPVITWSDWLL